MPEIDSKLIPIEQWTTLARGTVEELQKNGELTIKELRYANVDGGRGLFNRTEVFDKSGKRLFGLEAPHTTDLETPADRAAKTLLAAKEAKVPNSAIDGLLSRINKGVFGALAKAGEVAGKVGKLGIAGQVMSVLSAIEPKHVEEVAQQVRSGEVNFAELFATQPILAHQVAKKLRAEGYDFDPTAT